MNIIERVLAPTPKFFRVIRNVSIVLAILGGLILAVVTDATTNIATVASYLVVAGAVAAAVSQTAVEKDAGEVDALDFNGGGSGAGDPIK